jgi:hypothetical protein
MPARRYMPNPRAVALAALERGRLRRVRGVYNFGRRDFSPAIIEAMIAAGEARRLASGDIVKAEAAR